MGWIFRVMGASINPKLISHIQKNIPNPSYKFQSLNLGGYFVAVTRNDDEVFGYVASKGLPELYLLPFDRNILFSTNIPWLCKISGKCQFDFHRFGSRWMGHHQLSLDSFIRPIERLGPGGAVQISRLRELLLADCDKPLSELIKLWATFPLNWGYRIILLSGGLDSCLLLSALSQQNKNWATCIKLMREFVLHIGYLKLKFNEVFQPR